MSPHMSAERGDRSYMGDISWRGEAEVAFLTF